MIFGNQNSPVNDSQSWQGLICQRGAAVQFEYLRADSHIYRPRKILDEQQAVQAFCSSIVKGAPDFSAAPPHSQPWGWVGFFDAQENQLASITLQQRNQNAYLMIAGGGSRLLDDQERESIVQLMLRFDPSVE